MGIYNFKCSIPMICLNGVERGEKLQITNLKLPTAKIKLRRCNA